MQLGSYNPKTKVATIDAEAAKGWIAKGAQLSGTVHNLFVTKGILSGKKVNVLPKKTVEKKEEEVKAEAPAATPTPEVQPEAPAEKQSTEEAPAA